MPNADLGQARDAITEIERTSGNGSAGTIDTYSVWTETHPKSGGVPAGTFQVRNGANGNSGFAEYTDVISSASDVTSLLSGYLPNHEYIFTNLLECSYLMQGNIYRARIIKRTGSFELFVQNGQPDEWIQIAAGLWDQTMIGTLKIIYADTSSAVLDHALNAASTNPVENAGIVEGISAHTILEEFESLDEALDAALAYLKTNVAKDVKKVYCALADSFANYIAAFWYEGNFNTNVYILRFSEYNQTTGKTKSGIAIGNTGSWVKKVNVPTSRTIAGLSLENNIDKNELFSALSVKGFYDTLADLQTAYPSGNGNIYVVVDHWYYWNGSAWTDGGRYEPFYRYDVGALARQSFTLDDFYKFVNGGLYNGVLQPQTLYRVSCDEIINFDFDIHLTAMPGFKFGVHLFVDGSFSSDSGWQTSYKITKGTTFKITIAKYNETSTAQVDVDKFEKMVLVNTDNSISVGTKIKKIEESSLFGALTLDMDNWEQGGIDGGGNEISSSNEIRSPYPIKIPAGTYEIDPNGLTLFYFYYTSNGAFVASCGIDRKWAQTTKFIITFDEDKYIRFVQNKSSALLPSEHTLTITTVFPRRQLEFSHYKNGIVIMSKAGEGLFVPPESLISIKEAFRNLYDGYRINICKTSDGYYVLSHDRSINSIARNPDNSTISSTINIDEHTLAELDAYDFGIQYGTKFAGTKIARLGDAIALCSKLGLKLDIEWKYPTMTQQDAENIYETIVTNGYSNKNWHWIAYNETMSGYFKNVCEYVDIEVLVTVESVNYYLPLIQSGKTDHNNVIVGYSSGNYSKANIVTLRKMNIVQNKGTAANISQLIDQIENGVTEIECNFPNPKKTLIDYALNN